VLFAANSVSGEVIDFTEAVNALYSGDGYHTAVAAVLHTHTGQDHGTSRASEPSTLLILGAGLAFVARRARRVQPQS
jgi:hypothetical protein